MLGLDSTILATQPYAGMGVVCRYRCIEDKPRVGISRDEDSCQRLGQGILDRQGNTLASRISDVSVHIQRCRFDHGVGIQANNPQGKTSGNVDY